MEIFGIEVVVTQLMVGHIRVRHRVKKSYIANQRQAERMVENYQQYKDRGEIKKYLRSLSYRLKLQSEPSDENEED